MDEDLLPALAYLDSADREVVEFVATYLRGHDFSFAQGGGVMGSWCVWCSCGWGENTLVPEVAFRVARHAHEVIDQMRRELPRWLLEMDQ